jgi:hypothetical protein
MLINGERATGKACFLYLDKFDSSCNSIFHQQYHRYAAAQHPKYFLFEDMPTIGDENPTFADSTPPPIVVENTTGPSPTVNHRKPSSQLSFPADIHKNLLSTKKSTPDPGSWSDVGEEDKT